MPTDIQRSGERGKSEIGWLHSRFSFSFADYYDPKRMNFGALRVLNDDVFDPQGGFDMHPHADMEIVTIVLSGSLEHKDNMGFHGVIKPGEVQHISAGSGILHSEFNPSGTEKTSLLQIWVMPKEKGIRPAYEQMKYDISKAKNKLLEIVSGKRKKGIMCMHQDGGFFLSELGKGKSLTHKVSSPKHGAYVFVIGGSVLVNGELLNERDAAGVAEESKIKIEAEADSKILLIEVPLNARSAQAEE